FVSPDWLAEQVRRCGPQTHHVQLMAAVVLKDVTRNGLGIDVALSEQYAAEVRGRRDEKQQALAVAGYHPGTKGAEKALQEILERLNRDHQLDLPRTPTGKVSTKEDKLAPLAAAHPFLADLMGYKTYAKLDSTYLKKMKVARLHPSFGVLKRSGRTSSFGA